MLNSQWPTFILNSGKSSKICSTYIDVHTVGIKKGTFCNYIMNHTTVLCSKTTIRTTQNNKYAVLCKITNLTIQNYKSCNVRTIICDLGL